MVDKRRVLVNLKFTRLSIFCVFIVFSKQIIMFLKTNKLVNKRLLLTLLPEFPSTSLYSKYHHFTSGSCSFCHGIIPLQSSKTHVNLNTKSSSSSSNVNLIKLNSPTGQFVQSYRYFNVMKNPLYKKAKSHTKHEEDENDLFDDGPMGKGDKVLKLRLSSDRLDAVLKAGLNMSRNKIEKAFYADRIRINGVRPKKKSQIVSENDEIDVVRKYNSKNPSYLDVSRIEILSLEDGYSREDDEDSDDEAMKSAVLKRYKNLTIDNYKPPFKGNLEEEII